MGLGLFGGFTENKSLSIGSDQFKHHALLPLIEGARLFSLREGAEQNRDTPARHPARTGYSQRHRARVIRAGAFVQITTHCWVWQIADFRIGGKSPLSCILTVCRNAARKHLADAMRH